MPTSHQTSRKPKDKCATRYCRNNKAKRRRVCHKCIMRDWRKRNPKRAAYCTLKDHAKARRIDVLLTYEEFCSVVDQTDYIERSGRRRHELQLDRIDATKPYSLENVRVVSCSENASKSNYERRTDEHKLEMIRRAEFSDELCPF